MRLMASGSPERDRLLVIYPASFNVWDFIWIGARIDEVNTADGRRNLGGCWSIVLKPRGGSRLLTGSEVLSMLCGQIKRMSAAFSKREIRDKGKMTARLGFFRADDRITVRNVCDEKEFLIPVQRER